MTTTAHEAQEEARGLPAELEIELAAQTFADKFDAQQKINHGIRGRYLTRLYTLRKRGNLSDVLVTTIGDAIQRACDRIIRDLSPPTDIAQPRE